MMAIADYFIEYLEARDLLEERDHSRLRRLRTRNQSFPPGEEIIRNGAAKLRCGMLISGMTARAHHANSSRQRVITALHVSRDFIDLHGFVLGQPDYSVVSLGYCEVEFADPDDLAEISAQNPHLGRMMWLSTLKDAAIYRQWLVAGASLRSNAHLAHLLCEIYFRMAAAGAAQNHCFTLPMLQRELADILGYSPIHINRAVRDLRDRGLIRWRGALIEITDWPGLVELAAFDPGYLEQYRMELYA